MRGGGPGPSQVLDFSGAGQAPKPCSTSRKPFPRTWTGCPRGHDGQECPGLAGPAFPCVRPRDPPLDQVPDEELDRLARAGFTALWLIGVWERSPASREIKRRMGNPEAEASAYSLFDYVIAGELGGERPWRT